MSEEIVDVYDEAGRIIGTAPRSRVRAENLRHAATSIIVRDPAGRVFVHRRTDTKDVYPGLLDFCAGGVVGAGEDPDEAAVREAAEELGVSGVPLRRLGVEHYRDDRTDYFAHLYDVTYSGPITLQPEEVSWGEWMDVEELLARIDADPGSFVPDSVAVQRRYL